MTINQLTPQELVIQLHGMQWVPIPHDLILNSNLSSDDKIIYAFLMMDRDAYGDGEINNLPIMQALKMSDDIIRESIRRLAKEGWIWAEYRDEEETA
jgi:hypothetical protein